MKLEKRFYQQYIIYQIKKCIKQNQNCIIELDAGLGKRVIMYLLAQELRDKNILIVTPSRASLADTVLFFENVSKAEGAKLGFDYLRQGMPHQLRKKILEENRVVLATPITLTKMLKRYPNLANKWDLIIINEVDKVVKRLGYSEEISDEKSGENEFKLITAKQASKVMFKTRIRRTKLTYPWNELVKLLPDKCIIIGMSGTLRDEHIVHTGDKLTTMPEIRTLLETIFNKKETRFITMDELLRKTDVWEYLQKNLTIIHAIPVVDDKIQTIDKVLSEEIEEILKKIAKRECTENHTLVERAISLIEDQPLKFKLIRLVLARRFLVTTYPMHYVRFLNKPFIRKLLEERTGKKFNELIPNESEKIKKACEIAYEWVKQGSKVAILSSFTKVTYLIAEELRKRDICTYIVTGATLNKAKVLREFKESGEVLCFSPVGERDLDLPVDVLIIHDVIRTTKTMYQRMKRGRRSYVLILYYRGTHEEKKVSSLLVEIKRKYPWTIRVYV